MKILEVLGHLKISDKQAIDLPTRSAVSLSIADDMELMSEKYVDSQQDLGEGLARAKKGEEGRIEKESSTSQDPTNFGQKYMRVNRIMVRLLIAYCNCARSFLVQELKL